MAFNLIPVVAFGTATLAAGQTSVYQAPSTAGAGSVITKTVLSNPSASATVSVIFYKVSAGGVAALGNIVCPPISLAPGKTVIVNELNGMVLNSGDSVVAQASAGATVNLTMSAYVFTPA